VLLAWFLLPIYLFQIQFSETLSAFILIPINNKTIEWLYFSEIGNKNIEIIGNIHENTDLLKEVK